MSLRVWLPLNGNLNNKGLDEITVTNNGAIINNYGKIGKCYSFDGQDDYISLNNESLYSIIKGGTQPFSIAMWVYRADETRAILFGDYSLTGTINFNLELRADNCFRFYWGANPDKAATSTLADLNTWTHFVVTYDGSQILFYKNGVKTSDIYTGTLTEKNKTSGNYYLGRDARTGTTAFNGKMNDFRIYDHCLSKKEVKEISKGLILHYPLNNGESGQKNLLKYTKVNTINQNLLKTTINANWDKLTLTTIDNYSCYYYPSAQGPTWFSSGFWYTNMKANTTYTYTAWIYFTSTANFNFTSLGHFQVYNTLSTASDKAHEDIVSARIYQPSTIPANKWTKIRITFTTNNLANSSFVIYPRYNIAANRGDFYFRDCKLEENEIPTPWCLNQNDSEYIAVNLNNNIVYDCSGYQYNGISNNVTYKNKYSYIQNYNLLSNDILSFNNWTAILPNQISKNNIGKNKNTYHLIQSISGWEQLYSPAITVTPNKEYILTCKYKIYSNYTLAGNGDFGLTIMKAVPTNANPASNIISRIVFPLTECDFTKASITFTPTVSTIYLNINGGSIADNLYDKRFDIYDIRLIDGEYSSVLNEEIIESPKYNSCAYFNGNSTGIRTTANSQCIGEGDFTITAWVRLQTSGKSYQPIISNKSTGAASVGCAIYFNHNQNKFLWSTADGSGATEIWTSETFSDIYNKWIHIAMVRNSLDNKKGYFYINGVRKEITSTPVIRNVSTDHEFVIGGLYTDASQYRWTGSISDLRVYSTALSAEDVKELYEVSASVDRNNNFYTYQYQELDQGYEIQYLHDFITVSGSSANFSQNKDGLHLNQAVYLRHNYIPINPNGKTYKYDIIYSNNAGNLLYIGWERFDIDKTARSNDACTYVMGNKIAANYKRIQGTVNLSTDGVNPCAFIRLRILNKWTGSDSDTNGTATIHYLSLKEYPTTQNLIPLKTTKAGVLKTSEIVENNIGVSINRSHQLHSDNFYEI